MYTTERGAKNKNISARDQKCGCISNILVIKDTCLVHLPEKNEVVHFLAIRVKVSLVDIKAKLFIIKNKAKRL